MNLLRGVSGRSPDASPQIIFGIDVGTSYTKVAYVFGLDDTEIRIFQDWTLFGLRKGQQDFIPTVVTYKGEHDLRETPPDFYGSLNLEQRQDPSLKVYEWFKEDFPGDIRPQAARDFERPTGGRTVVSVASGDTDTMLLYKYFLERIHMQLKIYFGEYLKSQGLPAWDETRIEFIFSYPAAWDTMHGSVGSVRKQLLKIAKSAGFAEPAKYHSVLVELAEPQAAAASSLDDLLNEEHLGNGCQMLVIDSGGGTTDVCIVSLQKSQRDFELDQHIEPKGEYLGSSHIDRAFSEAAREKLDGLSELLMPNPEWDTSAISNSMMFSDEFQTNKKELAPGTEHQVFLVPGPSNNMLSRYSPEMLREHETVIRDGQILFHRREISAFFDTLIGPGGRSNGERLKSIARLINQARDENKHRLRDTSKQEGISKPRNSEFDLVLLTGGLGSNPYLKHKISQLLTSDTTGKATTRPPLVHVPDDPQLSVCKGLVHDRMRHVFASKVAKASYGVILPRRSNRGPVNPWDRPYTEKPKWLIVEGKPLPSQAPTIRYVFDHEDHPFVQVVEKSGNRKGNIQINLECQIGDLPQVDAAKGYCTVEIVCGIRRVTINLWGSSSEDDTPRRVGRYSDSAFASFEP